MYRAGEKDTDSLSVESREPYTTPAGISPPESQTLSLPNAMVSLAGAEYASRKSDVFAGSNSLDLRAASEVVSTNVTELVVRLFLGQLAEVGSLSEVRYQR